MSSKKWCRYKRCIYNAKIKNIEDKIPDITKLATNASLNVKMNEVKGKIPSFTNLATTAALTIPRIPKIKYLILVIYSKNQIMISEMKNNFFTTSHYDKFTGNTLDVKKR